MNNSINITDKQLIQKFIRWCTDNDFNQSRMGEIVGRTRAWASLLVKEEITSLSFDTRNRIKRILGIQ